MDGSSQLAKRAARLITRRLGRGNAHFTVVRTLAQVKLRDADGQRDGASNVQLNEYRRHVCHILHRANERLREGDEDEASHSLLEGEWGR